MPYRWPKQIGFAVAALFLAACAATLTPNYSRNPQQHQSSGSGTGH